MSTTRLKKALDDQTDRKSEKMYDFILENLSPEILQQIHDIPCYRPVAILLSRHSGARGLRENKKYTELEEKVQQEIKRLTNRRLRRNTQFSLEQALEATTQDTDLAKLKMSIDPLVTSITHFAEFDVLTDEDKRVAEKFRSSASYTPLLPYITPCSEAKAPQSKAQAAPSHTTTSSPCLDASIKNAIRLKYMLWKLDPPVFTENTSSDQPIKTQELSSVGQGRRSK